MLRVLDYAIKLTALGAFTYGSWLVFGAWVSDLIKDTIRLRKIMRTLKPKSEKTFQNPLLQHLCLSLSIVLKHEVTYEPTVFLYGSVLIFVFSFFLLIKLQSMLMTVISSALIAFMPYFLVTARLRSIRVEGSYDGVSLVTNLINNYKQSFCNMLEAVDQCVGMKSISSFTKSNLLRLSMKLKSYRTEDELDDAVHGFVYAYETEWAILLGMNVKAAVLNGTNITTSLDDILLELKNIGEAVEANKRYNNESFSMIKFVLVPLYLFSSYLCCSVFGFTFEKFLRYQFRTELGLKSAMLTFSSMVICFITLMLTQKPKYDF